MSVDSILTLAVNLLGTGMLTLFVWRIQQSIQQRNRKIDERDAMRDQGRSLAVQIDQMLGELSTELASLYIQANPSDPSWMRLNDMIKGVRELCVEQYKLAINQGTMASGKKG